METIRLKLKQASAVLGVSPKDLQNLIQLEVLKPPRRDRVYWFDRRLLLEAKLAFYLKESLGTSTELLSHFTEALSRDLRGEEPAKLRYVWLHSRPARGRQTIDVRIPLRSLAKEIEEQLPRASVYQDLPRGRKRPGWQSEFLRSVKAAAGDLAGVAESDVTAAIRGYRAERKRLPEISVGGSKKNS